MFGTIAAESQRLINETYTAFIQSFMPNFGRPDVDSLRNLSAAILVDQERMGANSRSTVGTATDAYSMLRLIFSRLAQAARRAARACSRSTTRRACARTARASAGCRRSTSTRWSTAACRSTRARSRCPNFGVDSWCWRMYAESGFFDPDKTLADYTEEEWEQFLRGPEREGRDPRA